MTSTLTEWSATTRRRHLRTALVTDRARRGAVPVDVYSVGGTHVKEKKDPAILEDLFSFMFSPFPSAVTPAFPWPIKGKAGRPIRGIEQSIRLTIETHHTDSDSNPEPIRAHKHTAEQRPSSRHPFTLSIRDLGPVPLSTICNPCYELSVLVTRAAATNCM